MAINGVISNTIFTDTITANSTIIKADHLNELSAAIDVLNKLKANVNNCDCTVCTSNCCQKCQSLATCQTCQTCQKSQCSQCKDGGCTSCH